MQQQTVRRLLSLLVLVISPALAEDRYALVIGNGAYVDIEPLRNPENDVRLVSGALEAVGFDVTLLVNADKRAMEDATRAFARRLDEAGRNVVGVFYFAGHGVTYEGGNWLIPVGARIVEAVDIEYETVSANRVLKLMENARNATDIMILDSCRNSPFRGFSLSGTRSMTRGLSRMDAPAGSFIAYSTAPGEVAYDGTGMYSPFAAAFAAEIRTPGVSIGDMMIEVRKRVTAATEGLGSTPQTPWDASSLTGRFAFHPGVEAADSAVAAGAISEPRPESPTVAARDAAELRYWEAVSESEDPAEYEAYLRNYPEGQFADLARARRERYGRAPAPEGRTAGEPAAETNSAVAFTVTPDRFRGIVTRATGVFAEPDQLTRRERRLEVGNVVNVTGRVVDRYWYRVELEGGQTGYALMSAIERF